MSVPFIPASSSSAKSPNVFDDAGVWMSVQDPEIRRGWESIAESIKPDDPERARRIMKKIKQGRISKAHGLKTVNYDLWGFRLEPLHEICRIWPKLLKSFKIEAARGAHLTLLGFRAT